MELPVLEPPIPHGRGKDARLFLEFFGILPRVPHLRASDWDLAGDPFMYYLTRRLSLTTALSTSKALVGGTWFHKVMENSLMEGCSGGGISTLWGIRVAELRETCARLHIMGEAVEKVIAEEKRRYEMARVWWQACMDVHISDSIGTLYNFLTQPHLRILATELHLRGTFKGRHPTQLKKIDYTGAAQIDLLLYHTGINVLYPVDFKTCDMVPKVRLAICPQEMQTHHYPEIVNQNLPKLIREYGLDKKTTVAGMIHVAVQKPSIEFGRNDRLFTSTERTITRGPRKGQVVIDKEYYGEPDFKLYLERCRQWYQGEGDYSHEAPKRQGSNAPVNISFMDAKWISAPEQRAAYRERLETLMHLSRRPPTPERFPQRGDHLIQYGKESPWLPFYVCPVSDWPTIMAQKGIVMNPRDHDEPYA